MSEHVIPYSRQDISQADIDAVINVLRSDWLTQGPAVPAFESAVATKCGAAYGVAVNSATSALHLACLALNVGPGDTVWTSPNTFVASANCALYCGAAIDFVDIDPHTWCLSAEALHQKLVLANTTSAPLPKVVIPVHFAGQSCDMAAIAQLAKEYGFRIIEDASHAIGGRYDNAPVGNCRYSDITVFSFHPVKIVTTGEGGMALTNDPRLAAHMRRLRSHGITRDPAMMTRKPDGPWCYEQIELGFNYRMTDMQAALGLSQLGRLDEFIARRHALAARYDAALENLPVARPSRCPESRSAWHLYVIRLRLDRIKATQKAVIDAMRFAGIGVNMHYIPVHRQPYYARLLSGRGPWPEADRYYAEAMSLPMYPALTDAEQDRVIAALQEAAQ